MYIPWFEQAELSGTKRDFRPSGASAGPSPLIEGRITKADVGHLLGQPPITSRNGRVWVYTLTTSHGIWIEPRCFHVTAGGRHLYALALRFNADGVLEHRKLVTEDLPSRVGIYNVWGTPEDQFRDSLRDALYEIDRDNGVSREYGSGRHEPSLDAGDYSVQ